MAENCRPKDRYLQRSLNVHVEGGCLQAPTSCHFVFPKSIHPTGHDEVSSELSEEPSTETWHGFAYDSYLRERASTFLSPNSWRGSLGVSMLIHSLL